MDFLGFGPADTETVKTAFQGIIAIPAPEDGLTFLAESVIAEPIREQAAYGGIRVKLMAKLGNSRIPLQIDIGYGDAITPGPETRQFPALLPNFAAPAIRAYPVYTVVAEKLEAMVSLGDQNSRMKDFFDVLFILRTEKLDPVRLAQAISATFKQRKTSLPIGMPHALTQDFAGAKEEMWRAFLKRNGITSGTDSFAQVVTEINNRLPYAWAKNLKPASDSGDEAKPEAGARQAEESGEGLLHNFHSPIPASAAKQSPGRCHRRN